MKIESLNKGFNFEKLVEGGTSRIYYHIMDTTTWAIISAYRDEYSENENRSKLNTLKRDIQKKYNLGFIELLSKWCGDGYSSDERAIFIPNISRKLAMKLGAEYEQHTIIYCDNGKCEEICMVKFIDGDGIEHTINEVVRIFNIDTSTPMNIELAREIFDNKRIGAYSIRIKGSNAQPFTLTEVYEIIQPKPSMFRGERSFRIF